MDNEPPVTNVARMAEEANWAVLVLPEGGEFHIELYRGDHLAHAEPVVVGKAAAISGPLVLVVVRRSFVPLHRSCYPG